MEHNHLLHGVVLTCPLSRMRERAGVRACGARAIANTRKAAALTLTLSRKRERGQDKDRSR
jgi:hypothetical protein